MKFFAKELSAVALALFCTVTAQAAVTPLNTAGASSTWLFEDSQTGLTWTNGNAFDGAGLTFDAAGIAAANLGTGWRLPTLAEFLTLYQDLGQVKQASTIPPTTSWGPFTTNGVQYWTSTPTTLNSSLHQYFMPQNPVTTGEPSHDLNIKVNTWAVSAIPESEQWALLMAGLGVIGTVVRRRIRSKR